MPKKTPEPLLYIQQPEIDFPEPDMQEIYMSKRTEGKSRWNKVVQTATNDSSEDAIQTEAEEDSSLLNEPLSGPSTDFNSLDETGEFPELTSSKEAEMDEEISKKNAQKTIDFEDDHHELQQIMAKYEMERQYETAPKPLTSKKKHTVSLKRVKGFKEMSMEEKLEYLMYIPKPLPPVPCIFTTGNRFIRGFLLSKMEHEIEIKTFDEKLLQIPISELKDIQMIGEKKTEEF